MDRGIGVQKQRAGNARVVFIERIARVGAPVCLLRREGGVQRQPLPLRARFRQHARVQHAQARRIRQKIAVLAQGGRILRIYRQLSIVEGPRDPVGSGIEEETA